MFTQTIQIDQLGRIALPKQVLDALGVTTTDEIILELTEAGVIIKSKQFAPITEQIAAMNLPVSGWEQMKQEIRESHHA